MNFRMWDTYADGYNGICIVLSKSKIQEQNTFYSFREVIYKSVPDYLKKLQFLEHLSSRTMENLYTKPSKDNINSKLIDCLCTKLVDYAGEKELRCYSLEKEKNELNINNAIKAIINFEPNSQNAKEWEEKTSRMLELINNLNNENIKVFSAKPFKEEISIIDTIEKYKRLEKFSEYLS